MPPATAPSTAPIHGASSTEIAKGSRLAEFTSHVDKNSQPIQAPVITNAGHGNGGAVCLSRGRNSKAVSAGLSVSELNAEITVETEIVSANCRKNCPMMPVMNAQGMNTALSTKPTAMTGPETCS